MILVKSAGVFMHELLPLLWDGTLVTLQITVFGSLLAVVVALVAALGKLSRWPGVKWLAIGFIELFRGTSLLVQLFWLFYVLPLPPFNITLTPYVVAIIGLGLHIGAYGAEILRGAILAVPKGQTEAALSLNISPLQCFTHVVLPQAIIHAIQPGTNLLIELLKNTSLVSLITLSDLTFRAGQLDQLTGNTLQIMGLTLLFYFVMAQILVAVMCLVDRRFQPGRKKRKAA